MKLVLDREFEHFIKTISIRTSPFKEPRAVVLRWPVPPGGDFVLLGNALLFRVLSWGSNLSKHDGQMLGYRTYKCCKCC